MKDDTAQFNIITLTTLFLFLIMFWQLAPVMIAANTDAKANVTSMTVNRTGLLPNTTMAWEGKITNFAIDLIPLIIIAGIVAYIIIHSLPYWRG